MRKIVLSLLFIVAFSAGYAQRFEGGLLAGFNGTQVAGDNYEGYHKAGALAGLYVQTDIAPAVFAGMEIKYSQKGSRNKIEKEDPDPEKYIMRLGYIEVPVVFGFRANDRSSVIGGVSFGYLMHSGEWDENGPFVEEDQHAFNDFDVQPFIGFRFDVFEKLNLDMRLAYSVLPVRGQPGEDATTYYWLNNQFNNVISLAVYYRIGR